MDVESVESLRETTNLSLDGDWLTLDLSESYNSLDTRVSVWVHDADSVVSVS